ncbi:Na+/H+ antiporter NhaA [Vibrio salinus]|uniref:Na+/H+ antiporter NhaA n=1 Tax=Vibrio salinus TaxID=2899784 RepID=UPI001E35A38D|nr:Na+/H+ antiporter NhaA [Vibrio salinus]MCE0492616.1 Na+/H+ antiporter NhaA [Vibrio salinus]
MVKIARVFFKLESAGGILLIIATISAMLTANSGIAESYHTVLHSYIGGMSVSHWVNDGLMAIFFLLIGLEVKREMVDGALKSRREAIFPAIAALGGMIAPAMVYIAFNLNNPVALGGWAIPAATDIAFAMGILALLGNRVPLSLKLFLLALAIIDDLGVIIIIALFYSNELSMWAISVGLAMTALLVIFNVKNVTSLPAYLIVGTILWIAVLKSGVHATLAGVIIGFVIPMKGKKGQYSPLKRLEHTLHPYVSYFILPLFAFVNAGISLDGISLATFANPIPLGIALGLFIGKPLGVFSFSWLAVKMKIAPLPKGTSFADIFAVAVLCGIGFTMSIFISSLAFEGLEGSYDAFSRLGILLGSTAAAIVGYFMLNKSLPKNNKTV